MPVEHGGVQRRSRAMGAATMVVGLAALARVARSEPAPAEGAATEHEIEVVADRAHRVEPSPRDPTAASTVVSGPRLREPGVTLAAVAARVPGVQIARAGSPADGAALGLRGAPAAETPVYLAGVRLDDDLTGATDLSTVPPFLLDRVELFRGTAPDAADRLGMGGAVLLEPRRPRRSEASVGAELGSHGARAAWAHAALAREDGAGALVAAHYDAARNDYPYEDDGGTAFDPSDDRERRRSNADHAGTDLWLVARTGGAGARALTVFEAYDRERGASGLALVPATRARYRIDRRLVAVTGAAPCARAAPGGDAPCTLELTTSALAASSELLDPARELGLLGTRLDVRGARVGWRARLETAPTPAWRFVQDLSREHATLAVDRDGARDLAARSEVVRGSAAAHHRGTGRTDVLALGALECHRAAVGAALGACDPLEPVGRVGIRWRVAETVSLLANGGRFARAPTLGERYGSSPLVRGNAALRPERSLNTDAGVRLAVPAAESGRRLALSAEVVAFARWADDLIAYRRTGFGTVRPYNVGRARLVGGEGLVVASLFDAVAAESSLTLLDPRDTSPGRALTNDLLPHRSRLVFAQALEAWLRAPLPGVDRVSAGARLLHRSSRFADEAGLVVLAAGTTLDCFGALSLAGDRFVVRAAVDDVLDAHPPDLLGLPLPGRTAHGSVEVTLP
ncbi:MAG: TonB-dependent receptor [Polyangiaceae bacterium]|nr:TonB-dependent receptor [Polyangiaceae bacterium]